MNQNALSQFCDHKVSTSEGEDQETWLYLRILFEADPKRCLSSNILTGSPQEQSVETMSQKMLLSASIKPLLITHVSKQGELLASSVCLCCPDAC